MQRLLSLLSIFAFLVSCSSKSYADKTCKVDNNWLYNKNLNVDEYLNIDVHPDSYTSLGYIIGSDVELANFLEENRLISGKKDYNIPPIFLRSESSLDCDRFKNAVKIVNKHYSCQSKKSCIWGYGLGFKAMPFGVPPPPPD